MYCTQCGAALTAGASFCHRCGVALKGESFGSSHSRPAASPSAPIARQPRQSESPMQEAPAKKGIVLVVVGILGLIFVYSLRPPSGFGEALMMLGQGREFYLREPVYLTLMALFGVILVFGVVGIVKASTKK